ncbi:MAG: alpha/beta fold hydrolase [Leptolinea sp.]|jgi:carboxylesterase|nr:alpha/beta fold hydrolase [Leptolinea sp.]
MNVSKIKPVIIQGGEPFYYPGNEVGILLIHGFTDSPLEMQPFGKYLNEKGYSVLGMRTTGHATSIDDLKRSRWKDLLASVEDGYALLKSNQNIKKIIIIGHSMGGAMTLIAGSYLDVDGLIVLAPGYKLSAPLPLLEYFNAFKVYWGSLKRKWKSRNIPNRLPGWYWYKPELSRGYIKYNEKPLICNLQLVHLANLVPEILPGITCPILLMGARRDSILDPNSLDEVFSLLGSQEKEILWFEKSSHMLPVDGERDLVFEKSYDFIERAILNK